MTVACSIIRRGLAGIVVTLVVLSMVGLGVGTGGVLAQAQAPNEPNDSRDSATTFDGENVSGMTNASSEGDEDGGNEEREGRERQEGEEGNATTANGSDGYPPGYSAAGVTDVERATERYAAAFAEYDNYTVSLNASSVSQTSTTRLNATTRADVADQRAYSILNTTAYDVTSSTETYYGPTATYNRTTTSLSDETDYGGVAEPFAESFNSTRPLVGDFLRGADYEAAGTTTRSGETLRRYEATELTNLSTFVPSDVPEENVTDYNVTFLVDRSGVIRTFSSAVTYTGVEGGSATTRLRLRVTNPNDTAVEEPGWLDEARTAVNVSTGETATNRTITPIDRTTASTDRTPTETRTPTPTLTMIETTMTETGIGIETAITTDTAGESTLPTDGTGFVTSTSN